MPLRLTRKVPICAPFPPSEPFRREPYRVEANTTVGQKRRVRMIKADTLNQALRLLGGRVPFIARGKTFVFIKPHRTDSFEVYRAVDFMSAERVLCTNGQIPKLLSDVFEAEPAVIETKWTWEDATVEQMAILNQDFPKAEATPPVENTVATSDGSEHIYILTNPMLPDLIKIGRTDRSPEERAAELSSASGVPTPFRVFRSFCVRESLSAEIAIHARLEEYRVASNREFFRIDPEWAVAVIDELFPQRPCEAIPFDGVEGDGVLQLRASNLRSKHRSIWPGLLAAELEISYRDADALFRIMSERGIITPNGRWA